MERLDEDTIPVEGTIYYEGDDMGTLYMAHSINDGETYMYDENNLEQEQTADHEQQEQQEHWDGTNEAVVHEQGEEENAQVLVMPQSFFFFLQLSYHLLS